jgi:hypothetical protein
MHPQKGVIVISAAMPNHRFRPFAEVWINLSLICPIVGLRLIISRALSGREQSCRRARSTFLDLLPGGYMLALYRAFIKAVREGRIEIITEV